MNAITNEELVSHVLGLTSPERASEIETAAQKDDTLSAKLLCMRRSIGADHVAVLPTSSFRPEETIQMPRMRISRWRMPAVVIALLMCCIGVTWAGWSLIKQKPLLSDRFDDNYGDRDVWWTPRRMVRVEDGHVRLFDRGYLVTMNEYPGPIKLDLRWRWNDLGSDFLYREQLSIVLRTSGIPLTEHPCEITDGVVVRFDATGGAILIYQAPFESLDKEKAARVLRVKLPADTWHNISITDDGNWIRVWVKGPTFPESDQPKPIVEFFLPDNAPMHRIAFYNRERLAGVSFESWLDDISIWEWKDQSR